MELRLKTKFAEIICFTDELTTGNTYMIVHNEHAVLIDPNQGELLCKELKNRKLQLDYIILTHEHCDHMAGIGQLRKEFPQAKTAASAMCSKNLKDSRKNMSALMNMYLYFLKKQAPEERYPAIAFEKAEIEVENEQVIFWEKNSFRFILLPGHTEGSMGIMLNDICFFSGDYLIDGQEVNTRFPGGSACDYEKITKPRLNHLKKGIHVYPGHGSDYIWEGV